MAMQSGGGAGSFVADINVTPMVDVMLVLLIIFMVITPLLQSGVSVALPESKFSDRDDAINKESSVVIAIPEDGQFYVQKDKVASVSDLPEKVKNLLKSKPSNEQIVYIKSGKLVKYGTVVSVVDAIREAGFDRIGLISEKEKDDETESATTTPTAK